MKTFSIVVAACLAVVLITAAGCAENVQAKPAAKAKAPAKTLTLDLLAVLRVSAAVCFCRNKSSFAVAVL